MPQIITDEIYAGFTLPIRSTRSSRLPKVPDRTRSMACTRLLLERYSIIPDSRTSAQDSYTTSTQLTTRSLLEHTDFNRIPSRSVHEQLDQYSILTLTILDKLDHYLISTPSTKRLMRDGLMFAPFLKKHMEGQCACVRSGSDRVHSSSDRVCSSSDRVRSGSDRVKSKGIGYGSGSVLVRSNRDRLDLDTALV